MCLTFIHIGKQIHRNVKASVHTFSEEFDSPALIKVNLVKKVKKIIQFLKDNTCILIFFNMDNMYRCVHLKFSWRLCYIQACSYPFIYMTVYNVRSITLVFISANQKDGDPILLWNLPLVRSFVQVCTRTMQTTQMTASAPICLAALMEWSGIPWQPQTWRLSGARM